MTFFCQFCQKFQIFVNNLTTCFILIILINKQHLLYLQITKIQSISIKMEWRQQQEVSRCPSPRRSARIPRNHFRQVPLKSLATTTLLMLAQQNVFQGGGGLAYAAEVTEKQAIEQQVEAHQQAEEGLQEQLSLEQRLKEAQVLEQKLRVELEARTQDAEADGLEDNDYAINSVEEFVDSDQLEEAGRAVNKPAEEVSQKHTTVPVSHNQAHNSKASMVKPKSLSLKKHNPAQLNKKQKSQQNKIGSKKMNMVQKKAKSPAQQSSHSKEPMKGAKQNKAGEKKQSGAKAVPSHASPQSVAQAPPASASKPHHAPGKKSPASPPKKAQQSASSPSSASSHHQAAAEADMNGQPGKQKTTDPEMNDLDAKRRAISATLAALKASKKQSQSGSSISNDGNNKSKEDKPMAQFDKQNNEQRSKQSSKQAVVPPGKATNTQQQVVNSGVDPDARAATQLSADALEYSMQTLDSSSPDSEAMDQQSAAMKEVEVVQPKISTPKEQPQQPPKHEQVKQAVPVHAEQKHIEQSGEKPKVQKSQQSSNKKQKDSHVAQKPQLNKDAIVKHHGDAAAAAKPVQNQHDKKEQTHHHQHQNIDKQATNKMTNTPHKSHSLAEKKTTAGLVKQQKAAGKGAGAHAAPSQHQSLTQKNKKEASAGKSKSVEAPEHAKKGIAVHPASHASTGKPNSAAVPPHLSQSEKKYSEAHKAQQEAKQFREKADELKKAKIAMQAKAADLGSQHEALQKKQEQKEELGTTKTNKNKEHEVKDKKVGGTAAVEKKMKSPNPMDLIAKAIKHQKEMTSSEPKQEEKVIKLPPVKKEKSHAHKDLPSKKPTTEQQEMLDANDMYSGLGQDHLHEVLKVQDIQPEKHMVTIEDSTLDLAEKPQAKKEVAAVTKKIAPVHSATTHVAPANIAPSHDSSAHTAPAHTAPAHTASTHVAPVHAAQSQAHTTSTHQAEATHKSPAHTAVHIGQKQSKKEHSATHTVKEQATKPKKVQLSKNKEEKKDVNKFQVLSQIGTLKKQDKKHKIDILHSMADGSLDQQQVPQQSIFSMPKLDIAQVPLQVAAAPAIASVAQTPASASATTSSASDLIKKLTAQAIRHQSSSKDETPSPKAAPTPIQTPTKDLKNSVIAATASKTSSTELPLAQATDAVTALLQGQTAGDQSQIATAADVSSGMADLMGQQDLMANLMGEHGENKDIKKNAEAQQVVKGDAKKIMVDIKKSSELPLAGLSNPLSAPQEPAQTSQDPLSPIMQDKVEGGEPAAPDVKKDSVVSSILAKMKKDQQSPKKLSEVKETTAPIASKKESEQDAAASLDLANADAAAESKVSALKKESPVAAESKTQVGESNLDLDKQQKDQDNLEELMQKFSQSDESHPDDQALTQKIIQKVKEQDKKREKAQQLKEIENTISQAKEQVVEQLAPVVVGKKIKVEKAPEQPAQNKQTAVHASPKPQAVESEKAMQSLLDSIEPVKPAAPQQSVSSVSQVKDKALGDYGEEEFKAIENMDGAFPSKADLEDPLNISKLEAEIKQAAISDSVKSDIKTPKWKKANKGVKSSETQIGQSSIAPAKKEISPSQKNETKKPEAAQKLSSVKDEQKASAGKTQAHGSIAQKKHVKPAQSVVQVSQESVSKTEDFGPFVTNTNADLKKAKEKEAKKTNKHTTNKAVVKPAQKSSTKSASKPIGQQTIKTLGAKSAVKQQASKPATKPVAKPAPSKQANQSAAAHVTPSQAKPAQQAKSLSTVAHGSHASHASHATHSTSANQKPQSRSNKKIKQQSLLGHQNQLEQQLDEKIRKKLEEEEAVEDDEKRLSEEIKQVMAQDDKKEEPKKEEAKKDEKPKEEKKDDKKEEKKDDKKDDKKDEKKEEKKEEPPKKETFDDPIIADSDYYYGEDPYHVRRVRPSSKRSMAKGARPPSRQRQKPKQSHSRFIDEDILDSLNDDQMMHRTLQDLHIHNEHTSQRAVEYLEQHIQKDNLALKDLVKKYEELDKTQTQIKKTQGSIAAERQKIKKLLEQLIARMDKDRSSREKNALKKLKDLEKEDTERRKQEEKEMTEQEQLARKIVEQEHEKLAKSDEIEERQMELRRKDARVQDTLRAVKAEALRVKRDISLTELHTKEAHRIGQEWQEKQTEKIGKDKDSLLKKYLKGRNEHEAQLRQLESTMKKRNGRIGGSMNHLTQTQEPKRDADEFDSSPRDGGHDLDFDSGIGGIDYHDDYDMHLPRMRLPRRRPRRSTPAPRGLPRRRSPNHDFEFYDPHLDEDTIPDSVGSPDLLHRVDELKRLQGGGPYPDPTKHDFYSDIYANPVDEYHREKRRTRYPRQRSRMPPLPPLSRGKDYGYGYDHHDLLPPFKPTTKEDKEPLPSGAGGQDGKDYYDYGPYGPITRDVPKRLSKKIEYMKNLRKNSPFSDRAVEEEKNKQEKERAGAPEGSDPSAYSPQDFEFVAQKTEDASGNSLGKLNELVNQVKTFQKVTETTPKENDKQPQMQTTEAQATQPQNPEMTQSNANKI